MVIHHNFQDPGSQRVKAQVKSQSLPQNRNLNLRRPIPNHVPSPTKGNQQKVSSRIISRIN